MDFNPSNPVIQRCIEGMQVEATGDHAAAEEVFFKAWKEATNDFEKYLAAFFISRKQQSPSIQLHWLGVALQYAAKVDSVSVTSALPTLYAAKAKCYEQLELPDLAKKFLDLAESHRRNPSDTGPFYHGTRSDLQIGDLLLPGRNSNYKEDLIMNHIYFTAMPDGAGLAAALASGEGRERVYIIEPTGEFENDPNVTDLKFPGNPTRSFRTSSPLKIVGELEEWNRQTPEQIQQWKERLAKNTGEIIN